MAESDEEQLTENNPNVNTISELPGRPYSLTMEVPLFLIMMAVALCASAISNILLFRTCVHSLNHTTEECKNFLLPDHSNTTRPLEEEVQRYTTWVMMAKLVMESLVPAVLSLFLGVWSDTYGRKPLVVWPLFGMSLSAIATVVYSMLDNLGPWWYLLTSIPFSITGGYTALFTGAYTYVSDISSTKNRSIRMTILELSFAAGSVIGATLSSYLLKAVGNVFLLLINATLYVAAYAFTNICLTESLTGALTGGLLTLFDFLLAREMIETCFKRRPNKGRAQLLLLAFANSLSIFILYGLAELKYMYTREKLHWAIREYSILEAADITMAMVAAFIGVTFVQKVLRVGDLALTIFAFMSATAGCLVTTFAVKSWHMYLAAGISPFRSLSAPLIRSHITKFLPVEDIAKVFALICALESLCPLLAPVVYNALYSYTIGTFPGAIFMLSAGIDFVCIIMLVMVKLYSWRASYQPLQVDGS